MNTTTAMIGAAAALLTASTCFADLVWDRSLDDSPPTDQYSLMSFGVHDIGCTNMYCNTQTDIGDFLTFIIGEGQERCAVILDVWISADDLGFFGIVTGDFFNIDHTNSEVNQLVSCVHHDEAFVGQGTLSAMGEGSGSQGFLAALGSGDHSF